MKSNHSFIQSHGEPCVMIHIMSIHTGESNAFTYPLLNPNPNPKSNPNPNPNLDVPGSEITFKYSEYIHKLRDFLMEPQ